MNHVMTNRLDMMSPGSGIHRPSNNGAPAKQTVSASKIEG
jgi:hypothetical protein